MKINNERNWQGRWINAGQIMVAPTNEVANAPYLRKTFECKTKPEKASIFLCGLGWHVLYVNGQKADDRVLAPTVSQFDKHVTTNKEDAIRQAKELIPVTKPQAQPWSQH